MQNSLLTLKLQSTLLEEVPALLEPLKSAVTILPHMLQKNTTELGNAVKVGCREDCILCIPILSY